MPDAARVTRIPVGDVMHEAWERLANGLSAALDDNDGEYVIRFPPSLPIIALKRVAGALFRGPQG
jgi:hypothetical protein